MQLLLLYIFKYYGWYKTKLTLRFIFYQIDFIWKCCEVWTKQYLYHVRMNVYFKRGFFIKTSWPGKLRIACFNLILFNFQYSIHNWTLFKSNLKCQANWKLVEIGGVNLKETYRYIGLGVVSTCKIPFVIKYCSRLQVID